MTLSDRLHGLRKWQILAIAFAVVLLIGYCDFLLPYEVTMMMFYFAPILFAAWYGDRRSAVIIAVVSAPVWWLANYSSQPSSMEIYTWAGCNRLATFLVVALGGAAMREQRETMQARVVAMERTRELEEEILRVSEREQMRLGQDLHDGLCQQLAAIDCAVACLRHDLEEKEWPELAEVNFIQEQISSVVVQARDLARGVFPVQIDEEGFLAALQEVVQNTNRLRLFTVTLKVEGEIKIKNPETGMHLFRIAQEALNNVTKHAHASRVEIEVSRSDHHLALQISDDGVGLPADRTGGKGIGMQTMTYRSKSMGGEVQVDNGREGGTVVRCVVPMEAATEALYAA